MAGENGDYGVLFVENGCSRLYNIHSGRGRLL